MAKKRAGWERMIYRGTAGSAAATLITPNVIDIGMSNEPEMVETTTRGDGTALPKKTSTIVCLAKTPGPFTMEYHDTDTHMAALLVAADAGTALAFKVVRINGGSTEFDGDCLIAYDSPGGLKDGMIVTFTLTPTADGNRDWS